MTHAWAEGVYEFIDKVERSWPRGAKAAYVSRRRKSVLAAFFLGPFWFFALVTWIYLNPQNSIFKMGLTPRIVVGDLPFLWELFEGPGIWICFPFWLPFMDAGRGKPKKTRLPPVSHHLICLLFCFCFSFEGRDPNLVVLQKSKSLRRFLSGRAKVCFLSNPQNLDISSLLTSPSASPFALALESASTMSHCRTCVGLYGFSFLFVAFWGGSSKNNRNTEIHVGVQIQIFPLVLWLSGRPPPPPVQLGHRLLKNLEAKAVSHVFSSAFLQFVSSGSCLAVNGRIRTASFSCINGQNPMFFHSCSSIARKSEPTSCIQRSRLKSCSMGSRCLPASYAFSETH